jgi:TRAP-type mannitol/chloroaromatic compound transport system permease small subunit
MPFLDSFVTRIGQAFAWLFVIAIVLSAYEVVMRYVFGAPSSWAIPLTTTLCQIGFALGGAWCMVRGEHIRITFVPDQLSPRRRWWVDLLALVTGAFYLGGLLYAVYLDARASIWKFGFDGAWAPERTPGPPNWPLPSIGKAALVIGTTLFLLVVLGHLVRHVASRRLTERG